MATHDEQEAGLDALLSPDVWKRRVVLWGGAIAVALAAIAFARLKSSPTIDSASATLAPIS